MSETLKTQVGGNHYKTLAIQPVEYAMANELGPCEFSILKYISRKKGPSRVEDLLKARHFLDILIEAEKKNDVKVAAKPIEVGGTAISTGDPIGGIPTWAQPQLKFVSPVYPIRSGYPVRDGVISRDELYAKAYAAAQRDTEDDTRI